MTTPATLIARDAVEYGPGWRYVEIDCSHDTTTSAYKNGEDFALSDADVVRTMLLKHYSVEGCSCTRRLRKRYGLTR